MDNLVQTLRSIADSDDPTLGWTITNSGGVIGVRASSKSTFNTVEEAVAEAQRIVRELTADGGHRLVNRAELGASIEPYGEEPPGWRGKVDVVLWPTDQLGENHTVIELP